jgi:hypothetical protein
MDTDVVERSLERRKERNRQRQERKRKKKEIRQGRIVEKEVAKGQDGTGTLEVTGKE